MQGAARHSESTTQPGVRVADVRLCSMADWPEESLLHDCRTSTLYGLWFCWLGAPGV